jgi:murein endopeptidase
VPARRKTFVLLFAVATLLPAAAPAFGAEDPYAIRTGTSPIAWRPSRALGTPAHGRLMDGVQLPAHGTDYVTWDFVKERRPDRPWRRWGTDTLIRKFLRVARQYRAAHPLAPKLVVGDISRPHGGPFGPEFGGVGHASHQNGLDLDIYYPRRDRRLVAPTEVSQIDHPLAQDLVNRFVAAGAQLIFVGPHTGLKGPPRIVQTLYLHDNHMHVRIPNPLGTGGPATALDFSPSRR